MDENTYLKLIVDQIKSLRISAAAGLPAEHRALGILDACIKNLESPASTLGTPVPLYNDDADYAEFYEAPAAVIPDGFTEVTLAAFLAEQGADGVLNDGDDEDEYGEPYAPATLYGKQDIVGTIIDPDGTITEVGNIDQSAANVNEAVAAFEAEEEEEIEVENAITISYSRLDGQELTEDNVTDIINHPISDALKHFGTIQLISINDSEEASTKKAVFSVLEDGKLSLKTVALGVTAYRGVSVFPGLGKVKAVGSVNFL